MAEVKIRMRQKRDTLANWTSNNPTLAVGEIGIVSDGGYFVLGNGAAAFADLILIESRVYYSLEKLKSEYLTQILADIASLATALAEEINNRTVVDDAHSLALSQLSTDLTNEIAFRTAIDQIHTDAIAERVLISDIIDNLVSSETQKPLSAAQGKVLKDLIDALTAANFADGETPTGTMNGVNTVFTTANNYISNSIYGFIQDGGIGAPVPLVKGINLTETGLNEITLSDAPAASSVIKLFYRY